MYGHVLDNVCPTILQIHQCLLVPNKLSCGIVSACVSCNLFMSCYTIHAKSILQLLFTFAYYIKFLQLVLFI